MTYSNINKYNLMYSLIAISYVKELLIIILPINVFIAVFGIVGEISIGVDFIAGYFLRYTPSIHSFALFISYNRL